jgi:signal peptidase II
VRGLQKRGTVATLIPGRRPRLRTIAFSVVVVVVAADRITTWLAEQHLHGDTHVWGPFGLALRFNSGLAFSAFSGRASIVTVLLAVGTVVVAALVWRVRTVPQAIGGGLLLGGALGNLSERVISSHHGQVADFITLTHWPTFNAADASITIGAIVLAASLLRSHPAGAAP